jgi:predicted nicotinamide N-methyase
MAAELNPERIFETLTAYQASAALAAAIELDLFTHVGAGLDTPAKLAQETGASERGLRALLSYLVVRGFLERRGAGFAPSAESARFLDRRSAEFLGSVATFLTSAGLRRCFEDLGAAVRRGGTVEPGGGTVAAENPVWVDFARAMQPMARPLAERVAEVLGGPAPRRVLDVAAGHGLYGIELARRSPAAEVVAQDWPSVLEVARENARAAGVGGRLRLLPGSAFAVDWGTDFDLVLLPNFLHHFGRAQCVQLLAKARAALRAGGRVAALEFVVDEGRTTPARPAAFDLVMVATTAQGESYTQAEYAAMFRAAGLPEPERLELVPAGHSLLVATRRS